MRTFDILVWHHELTHKIQRLDSTLIPSQIPCKGMLKNFISVFCSPPYSFQYQIEFWKIHGRNYNLIHILIALGHNTLLFQSISPGGKPYWVGNFWFTCFDTMNWRVWSHIQQGSFVMCSHSESTFLIRITLNVIALNLQPTSITSRP